ncbi:hypothetical protein VE02_07461 [Pseudogymnoascus sp. 03VT05]|nr:hypothetical protein VE02_07461 [Pseudogymnoascus sp. 03VT05]
MFLEAVAAGTARPQVVLSVCAIASIFHLDAKNQTSLKEHGFSTQWAKLAGKLAFQEVESPNEDNIVAFINLGLFWYSQGSWRRSYIHKGNALQLANLLGFGIERPDKESALESEIQRRRLWACYLMNCHAPGSVSVPEVSETAQKLRLPWRDEDFEAGFCAEPGVSLDSGLSKEGIFCETVKAMTYWTTTPQSQRPPSRAPIAEEDQPLTPADPNPTTIVQQDLYAQPSPTLDFFHPFLDPEILDNFPDSEVLDFSQYGTIPSSFDFFDGWDLGAGEVP